MSEPSRTLVYIVKKEKLSGAGSAGPPRKTRVGLLLCFVKHLLDQSWMNAENVCNLSVQRGAAQGIDARLSEKYIVFRLIGSLSCFAYVNILVN